MTNASAADFKITITALAKLEQATASIRKFKTGVNTDLLSITKPLRDIDAAAKLTFEQLGNLAHETGLSAVARGADKALRGVERLGRGIAHHLLDGLRDVGREALRFGGLIVGLGAGFGVVGVIESVKSSAERLAKLGEGAVKTGVPVRDLARAHYSAKMVGIDPDVEDKAFERLNHTLADVATGKGKDFKRLFDTGGIKIWADQVHHKVKPTIEVFKDLAESIHRNANNRPWIDKLSRSMGLRSSAEMLPLLIQGRKALEAQGAEYAQLHGDDTAASIKPAQEAVEAFRKLDVASEGLRDSLAIALAPAITDLVVPLTKWVSANRELIATKVGGWAKEASIAIIGFLDYLKTPKGQKELHDTLVELKDDLSALAGGLKSVMGLMKWVHDNWSWAGALVRVDTYPVRKLAGALGLGGGGDDAANPGATQSPASALTLPKTPKLVPNLFDFLAAPPVTMQLPVPAQLGVLGLRNLFGTGGDIFGSSDARKPLVDQGVRQSLNTPLFADRPASAAPPLVPPPRGSVDMTVRFENAPPGMSVGTSAKGDITVKPPTGVPFQY
jgi:hypothetical protein